MDAGIASVSSDESADRGSVGKEPSSTEASTADARRSENQSTEQATGAMPTVTGSSGTVIDGDYTDATSVGEGFADSQSNSLAESQKIWVVDKAAWVETIPIYESVERSVCNICGADITGNMSAHSKQHMLAGEGSGYHSEIHQEKTEEKAVAQSEEGHWETVVIGRH